MQPRKTQKARPTKTTKTTKTTKARKHERTKARTRIRGVNMLPSFKSQWKRGAETLSRRELFRRSALLTLPALFRGSTAALPAAAPAAADGLRVGETIYQSIGGRPLINARGTFT